MEGSQDDARASALNMGEQEYEQRQAIRLAARKAFVEADDETRIRRAAFHRTRPEQQPLQQGDVAYVWRKVQKEVKPHWL